MRDNELIRVFLPIIQNGLISYGYTNVTVKQSNQPTQQGINTNPTVYFFKIGDHRYGYLTRIDEPNPPEIEMIHTEIQLYETTFQLSSLVLQNPKTPYSFTASDLVNDVAAILQSEKTVEELKSKDVAILRIQNISNPYFLDDRDNFEASPFFEFTLTHRQVKISTIPKISSVEYDVYSI